MSVDKIDLSKRNEIIEDKIEKSESIISSDKGSLDDAYLANKEEKKVSSGVVVNESYNYTTKIQLENSEYIPTLLSDEENLNLDNEPISDNEAVEEKIKQFLLKNREDGPIDSQSQFDLAKRYNEDKKYEKALYWYIQAAKQGHAEAQCEIAWRMRGKDALKWYRRAAIQGYVKAQSSLGDMYYDGIWIQKDNSQAFYWYCKASEQKDVHSLYRLGLMDLDKAWQRNDYYYFEAIGYFLKAAKLGSVIAQYEIAETYRDINLGDYVKAVNWYRKVAQQGFTKAQFALGVMYKEGRYVKQNILEAVYWWNLAVLSKDDHDSKWALKRLYGLEDIEDEDYEVRPQAVTYKLGEELKVIEKVRRLIEKSKQNPVVAQNDF